MKKITSFTTTILIFLFSINLTSQNNKVPSKTLSDLIIYDIQIQNTAKISLDSSEKNNLLNYQDQPINEYLKQIENKYLNNYQFKCLKDELKNILKNNKLVFFDGYCGEFITIEKAKEIVSPKDSVKLLNSDGEDSLDINGNVLYRILKNEFYNLNNITKLRFYEEWKINSQTGMLEKNILGYSIVGEVLIYGNKYETELFGIAKDKNSVNKIRQQRVISNYCE